MLQRVKEVQESDLRMSGSLAHNIQRVIAVTQAQIDAAAAQGRAWVVKPVVKVSDPLDNLRGGTQLVIKQNAILPGQNVMRVMYVGGTAVVVGPDVPPLSLPDATANDLLSLTAFGGTSQASTPTPDAPIDIVCNNGALKAKHQSGLPLGYTLLEYISANNGPYIETDIKIASTDIVETEFANNSSTGYGALYGIYDTGQSSAFYANQTYYGYDAANNKVDTGVSVDTNWHTAVHNFVDGTLTLDGNIVSFTPFSFTNSVNNAIFARYYNGSYGYFFRGKIRKHKVTRGNTVLCDMVPVRNDSTNELGLYDLINDRFWTNSGSGSFSAGDPVSDPVEIYTDGPIETIAIKDDQSATVSTATCENLLSISDNTDKQEIIGGIVTRKVGVKVLDGTESWSRATNQDGSANYVFYTQIDDKKIGNAQPMLCTHYDYIGSVSYVTLTTGKFLSNSANTSVYFDGGSITTVTNWKKWLVDQAAAGTPVIVIYPLATETTETVTGQPMSTAEGDCTAEITQAGMAGLELEVEYIKAE